MAVAGYTTLRMVVDDLLLKFKQVHANADVHPFQMAYWILTAADRIKKLHIQKLDSGAHVTPFVISVADLTHGKGFILPANIYDWDKDDGIEYIIYAGDLATNPRFSDVRFSRTTPVAARRLYFDPDEAPSATNPYFYRLGNDVYFLGANAAVSVEVGLYTTFSPNNVAMDIDQPFDFPQDLIPLLERQILDMGTWVLNTPKNRLNDPVNAGGQVPQKKWLSVEDNINPEME